MQSRIEFIKCITDLSISLEAHTSDEQRQVARTCFLRILYTEMSDIIADAVSVAPAHAIIVMWFRTAWSTPKG